MIMAVSGSVLFGMLSNEKETIWVAKQIKHIYIRSAWTQIKINNNKKKKKSKNQNTENKKHKNYNTSKDMLTRQTQIIIKLFL